MDFIQVSRLRAQLRLTNFSDRGRCNHDATEVGSHEPRNRVSMPPSEAWLSYQYLSGVLKTHLEFTIRSPTDRAAAPCTRSSVCRSRDPGCLDSGRRRRSPSTHRRFRAVEDSVSTREALIHDAGSVPSRAWSRSRVREQGPTVELRAQPRFARLSRPSCLRRLPVRASAEFPAHSPSRARVQPGSILIGHGRRVRELP